MALVREVLETVNRTGSWAAGLDLADPELEFETDPSHPLAGIYRGREEVKAFLAEFEAPYERTLLDPEQIYARGDQVVTLVQVSRRPQGGSTDIESRVGFWWTLRDGRIVREQAFAKREMALEAAGLGEDDAVA